MKRVLIWDLPVRLFHLLLGVAFVGAFAISQLADDDGPWFSAHMLLGLLMAFMVVLRLLWGFFGTRHARLGSFAFGPRAVLRYLGGAIRGRPTRHAGHNPGAAVAIFVMFVCVIGLAVTGIMMGRGDESVEGVHELLAYGLLVAVIAHLVGVALHTFRHRENITRSMIDGTKEADPADAIPSARPLVGLAFLALTALVGWRLAAGYDPATRTLALPLIGEPLQLGEVEGDEAHRDMRSGPGDEHDDDD
ncbi:MAG: cytochrome b/b6 domain-containing protein [Deltaproteobacteria bacterium]|nr:cytochrome b/b6 domain-containing protein [Deltaproteobacteria bacterium]